MYPLQLHNGAPGTKSRDPTEVAQLGPWFLEIFSGTARLSSAVRSLGIPVLPPVDIEVSPEVGSARDVGDLQFWDWLMSLALLGGLFFVHFGTPCNAFSQARKDDGGPPPLRSAQFPMGLPDLSEFNHGFVFLGNLFLERTEELAMVVFWTGGDFSIENPLYSFLWQTPLMMALQTAARTFDHDFDQCCFGAPSLKPTRLRSSTELFNDVACRCSGGHRHIVLKGRLWDPQRRRWIYRTKLAQEYPHSLCQLMAYTIRALFLDNTQQFEETFQLTTPAADRKRPLGQLSSWQGHRQAESAQRALAAGYQLKRGAAKPLLDVEMEPGQAVAWALAVLHPFTQPVGLPSDVVTAVHGFSSK